MSYLTGIYLESGFSWLIGWGVENTDKKLKNEEKEKHIIQKKSNDSSKYLCFYLLYKSLKAVQIKTFIYSFYAMQNVWIAAMTQQSLIFINIQIIVW